MEGISHVTLAVTDLERSFAFYSQVLRLKPVAKWDEGAYLLAGKDWVTLLSDAATRTGPLPEYTHTAFSIHPDAFGEASARLSGTGAEIWQENPTEGRSLYFLDPDGHKLEIRASDFESRLRVDRRDPPPGMRFFD